MITAPRSKHMISGRADNQRAGNTLSHMQTLGFCVKYCPEYVITVIITRFTKYSNNLLSFPARYCSFSRTHSGLLVHRCRTARAPILARSRCSIKMAERPIKPQVLNTLTSLYKNKAQKAIKDCVCKQII